MSRRPWMPIYVSDYLGDTKRLTMAEHGAYLLLIMEYWQHGGLPDDDARLAKIVGATVDEWLAVRSTIVQYFSDGWKHKRIEAELVKAEKLSKAGEKAGKASAIARSERENQRSVNDHANDLATICQPLQPQLQERKKELSPKRVRTGYSDEFEEFWKVYPRTPNMSKVKAFGDWRKLSTLDQIAATLAAPKFVRWLRERPGHGVVHACRFLSERRFDGFQEDEAVVQLEIPGFHASSDSLQLEAWDQYGLRTKGKRYPRDRNGGWRFPTEWPPDYEEKPNGIGNAQATA